MNFKASLDNVSIAVSMGVAVLFAVIIIMQIALNGGRMDFTAMLISALLVAIYSGVFLFRTLSYEVTTEALVISRPLRNMQIPLHSINTVELVNRDVLRQSIRTFGVGGLFGYYGKFYHRKLGPMTWYATRRDKGVLLILHDNQKILLTPDEPERFLRLLAR